MPQPTFIWNQAETEFLSLLENGYFEKNRKIRFYAPSFSYYKTKFFCSTATDFPTISITGASCSLNCSHCGGVVLQTMHPAPTPNELYELCVRFKRDGAKGCLISGGCLPDGSVPLDYFVPTIARIKRELALTVFVHTGIISQQTALSLSDAGVDAALIDVIGSEGTIQKVFNTSTTLKDYLKSLKALDSTGICFVPHVIVGLNEGKLDSEVEALKMISQVKPAAVVIIAFMPIPETAMAKTKPPTPIDIAKVAAVARLMFPRVPVVLGCMRPKGKARAETDVLALKAGVDAVAFPSEEAIKYAKAKGYEVSFSSSCCAQIYRDAAKDF